MGGASCSQTRRSKPFCEPFSGSSAMSLTGTIKKFMEDKGFGFITPDEGGDDVFIHIKQCNGAESLSEGDKVSYDSEWNDRKGKMGGTNCTVTSSGGGGGGGKGGGKSKGYSPW